MTTPHDLLFERAASAAHVVFVGRRCASANLLHDYASGILHFVREGHARIETAGGPPIELDRPSLVFFPRAGRHAIQSVDESGVELVCAITRFSEPFLQTLGPAFPETLVVPMEELAPIRYAVEAFFAEAQAAPPEGRQLADRLCGIVLAYLLRHLAQRQAGQSGGPAQGCSGIIAAASDQRIAGAMNAIHTSFDAALDLATLARVAGMSRSRFVEHFKRLVGTSPHNYLVNYRIGVAQQLLASRVPVKTVAGRVGYETTASFVRKFKEVVGVSPGAWAK
ncbi:helix-turn-helix domain-containing protein [Caenimonas aquaedulcis]|uniref:Helix-turn-helix transcriptional regulator n=1 Tax=Caenimonas aquaedulcis TaxID=2793270 RepID=A0A931MEI7_9BURK|nr:AraC family transcriptional regulator [Caenimonas aquaedulcis]MBG9386688.1 helix-turn-helix transcriptional regulator [Caenimonas aquaedulcis]